MADAFLHLRLSDGVSRAVPFTARDGRSLADACVSAYARYVADTTPAPRTPPVLEIQVRPLSDETSGWFSPCQVVNGGAARYVRVYVSAAILERRPPDDWTEIWSWCEASRAHDRALSAFARRAAECLPPDDREA